MKKTQLVITALFILLLGFNFFYLRKIKRSTVEFQKEVIMQQAENLGSSIEKTIHDYESDLTRIIFRNINEIHQIFDNKESMFYISRDL